jgi:hypothetical protein
MRRFSLVLVALMFTGCYSADDLREAGIGDAPGDNDGPSDPSNPDDPDGPAGPDLNGDGVTDDYDWDAVAEPELAPDAVILDEEPCVSDVEHTYSDEELTIWTTCEVSLSVGDIVVGTNDGGYLREIVWLDVQTDRVIAQTTQATLSQVLVNGGFDETIVWENEERETWDWSGTNLYSGNHAGVDVSVDLTRAIVKFTPEMRLKADFGWFSLKRADAQLDVDFELDAELRATLSGAVEYGAEKELGSFTRPFAFAAGPVPVSGTMKLTFTAGFETAADAEAQVAAGAEIVADMHLKGMYEDGNWAYDDDRRFDAAPRGPEWQVTGHAEAKLYVKVDAQVMLYGVAGPNFDVDPYARAEADAECWDIPWSVHGGIDTGVGLNLDLYVWETNKQFGPWNWETEVASGNIDLPYPLSSNCGEEIGVCAPVSTISCGQTVSGNTATDEGATRAMSGYPINTGNYEAPELVYEWAGGSGEVEFRFIDPEPYNVNHDIIILDGSGADCSSSNALVYGFNSLTWTPEGAGPFYVVIDGYDQDEGAFELELDCSP